MLLFFHLHMQLLIYLLVSDGDGLATLGSYGGNLFEPVDAEERRGTFEVVGGPDWSDD